VFDNLSTGFRDNVPTDAELFEGDIRDEAAVRAAVEGVEVVFHFAAHRAVLQSVENPLSTDLANTHGTLLVLKAAQDAGVRRVVAASSSSVYGGAKQLPTPESAPLIPRSPYAVSKLAGEHYTRVWSELFDLETVALRYFNVYGPRQNPESEYAAVIPRFVTACLAGEAPVVFGDGEQTRDFTYVGDAVAANLLAADAPGAPGAVVNVAGGRRVSLNELLSAIRTLTGAKLAARHEPARPGDVRDSLADLSRAKQLLGYEARVDLHSGLARTIEHLRAASGRRT